MEDQYVIQQTVRQEEKGDEGPREGELREQDMFLPIYNISEMMKKVLPHSSNVAMEAMVCVRKSVSDFINLITRFVSYPTVKTSFKTIFILGRLV